MNACGESKRRNERLRIFCVPCDGKAGAGIFEGAVVIAARQADGAAHGANPDLGIPRVAGLALRNELISQADGALPISGGVLALDAVRLQVKNRWDVAEAFRESSAFGDDLSVPPKVSARLKQRCEVGVRPGGCVRSVRLERHLQAPLDVGDSVVVTAGEPGDADGVQGMRPKLLETELLGHRERFSTNANRRVVVIRQHPKSRDVAEDACF